MNSSAPASLTRNQALVMDALEQAKAPLSAYALLEQLRASGLRAPPQVYRALETLVAQGRVHKLESLSAFVACQHPQCSAHRAAVFMICDACGAVVEKAETPLGDEVLRMARHDGFRLQGASIELRGMCPACAKAGTNPAP